MIYIFRLPFYMQIVPTVDTVRYNFLMNVLIANCVPVMLVGPVGTGKTSVAQNSIGQLDSTEFSVLTVNMSARVSTCTLISSYLKTFMPVMVKQYTPLVFLFNINLLVSL